jgi:hypothetical protein
MSPPPVRPTTTAGPARRAHQTQSEQRLPREEFERRVQESLAELDGPELENLQSLLRWFARRYPTARERLAYTRRKFAEWTRRPVPSGVPPKTSARTGHTAPS